MTDADDLPTDALSLLAADHEDVRRLFAEYEELVADDADAEDRLALAGEICDAITAHATAEEEIFYPALRTVLDDDETVDEAESEHASARELIEQIEGLDADDERFDATMRVLGEAIDQHAREEEAELFPRARESGLDLDELGQRLAERKEEVRADLDAGEVP